MTFPILPSNPVTGYNLTRSLRFRASASAYLSRTPASAGNQKTWTYSNWIKRGTIGSEQLIFNAAYTGGALYFYLRFLASDVLEVFTYDASGGTFIWQLQTTQVFRDPSAWYHIVISTDTTQATASNRVKIYVNGSQVTAFSVATYPSLNYNTIYNFNVPSYISSYVASGRYFDGYMAEFNSIDGQALTPSSFGSTNSTTGVWQPAKYTGTYGTNGFYLPFTDNSALTTSSNVGLGKDFSGNGNYWTTNNISITAGVTYDSMTDVPTLTSATAANFAVLNPLDYVQTSFALSNANLTWTTTTTGNNSVLGSIAMTSGKYYWEIYANSVGSGSCGVGVAKAGSTIFGAGQILYVSNTGQKSLDGTLSAYGATWASPNLIGVAYDATAGQITFYKDNVSQGVITLTGYAGVNVFPVVTDGSSLAFVLDANFGQRPFAYTPPTGFVALNTYNLPDSTIKQGNKVMDATLYTGTLLSNSVVNAAAFKPDLVWLKSRSAATNNELTDSVRGVTKALVSNSTAAEATDVQGLTAFNTNGFTVGTNTDYNNLAATYVAWQWQAGQGSSSSNTNGTITSTVSVNASAGFSVVTYTGTGANATVGHGLGVAPSLIITKSRTNVVAWPVYTSFYGKDAVLQLESSTAGIGAAGYWGTANPTSSVFGVGTNNNNISGASMLAYCFAPIAGYSAFGSFVGNGSADGAFVYFGFRPKFVMIKRTDSAANWVMVDSSRSTYNVNSSNLYANLSNAEDAANSFDFLSNGIKFRSTATDSNASGGTYIYAAFAESPFKNSLAR